MRVLKDGLISIVAGCLSSAAGRGDNLVVASDACLAVSALG
jgi:hypothetical protein